MSFTTSEFTEEEKIEIENKIILEEKIEGINKIKQEKSEAISKIASLSDQLNLIAGVLDTLTSGNPDQAIIANAKTKFAEIKDILNK